LARVFLQGLPVSFFFSIDTPASLAAAAASLESFLAFS